MYLGEHYVTDLIAGFALAEAVRIASPHVAPTTRSIAEAVRLAAPRVAPALSAAADGIRSITPETS